MILFYQADTTKRFFELFKGVREPELADDDDNPVSSDESSSTSESKADAKDSSSEDSESEKSEADEDRSDHVMSADQKSTVEKRLQSLILPPRAGSTAVRKPFKHTGQ